MLASHPRKIVCATRCERNIVYGLQWDAPIMVDKKSKPPKFSLRRPYVAAHRCGSDMGVHALGMHLVGLSFCRRSLHRPPALCRAPLGPCGVAGHRTCSLTQRRLRTFGVLYCNHRSDAPARPVIHEGKCTLASIAPQSRPWRTIQAVRGCAHAVAFEPELLRCH